MGKPIVQAREEIDFACERSKAFMDMAEETLKDEIVEHTLTHHKKIIKEPVIIIIITN
jgi:acyl-CoA reductase-like NAD-dependent aldehyde dehydrogenase